MTLIFLNKGRSKNQRSCVWQTVLFVKHLFSLRLKTLFFLTLSLMGLLLIWHDYQQSRIKFRTLADTGTEVLDATATEAHGQDTALNDERVLDEHAVRELDSDVTEEQPSNQHQGRPENSQTL